MERVHRELMFGNLLVPIINKPFTEKILTTNYSKLLEKKKLLCFGLKYMYIYIYILKPVN